MHYHKLLNKAGIIGLSITFIYFILWTPIIRRTCNDEAGAFATEIHTSPSSDEAIQSVGMRYSLQYASCVHKHGVAE